MRRQPRPTASVARGLATLVMTLSLKASAQDSYRPCPDLPMSLPSLPSPVPTEVAVALERVSALLETAVRDNNVSGLIATVVYKNETLWTQGYGSSDPFAHPTPAGTPTGSHLLRVASITKTFTSMLMFMLRDAGLVAADDDVRRYITAFDIQSTLRTQNKTTLRQLASHTSGLPRDLEYPCGFNPNCSAHQVYTQLAESYLVVAPGTRFHYSNVGFALLGRALEAAWNASRTPRHQYEDLVEELLLMPLNMTATFNVTPKTVARMAVGINPDGTRATVDPLGWEAPAGGLLASANDMAKWMKFHLRGDAPKGRGMPVDGTTVVEALAAQTALRDGTSAVGLPWEYKYSSGVWTKSKQGELPGFRSSVTLVDSLGLGVFTSALQSDVPEDSVWSIPVVDIIGPSLRSAMAALSEPYQLPSHYKQFIGQYFFNSSVFVSPAGILEGFIFGEHLNFTEVIDHSATPPTPIATALRAAPVGYNPGCRWLDDGSDLELIYFDGLQSGSDFSSLSTAFRFMGSKSERLR